MRVRPIAMKTALAACVSVIVAALLLMGGCEQPNKDLDTAGYTAEIKPIPPGLTRFEAMVIPSDNPMTPEKVALGRQLFFDKRLSADESRSCYSCHVCEKGLTDGLPKAVGAFNKTLKRGSPTLWNIGYHKEFYWDGRSGSLEKQAMAAWQGGNMGAKDKEDEIVGRINALQGYRGQFRKVFGTDATKENIMMALSAFERTITSGNGDTPVDRWQAGDESAVADDVKRGRKVFEEVKCTNCHDGVLLTDMQYHNVGIGMDLPEAERDNGRFDATKKPEDTGAFKTPTLRDVAKSAPYFHDGSTKTLEEAVELMLGGGKPNQYLDKKNLEKREITKEQKQDLLAYLRALSVDCSLREPSLPQK